MIHCLDCKKERDCKYWNLSSRCIISTRGEETQIEFLKGTVFEVYNFGKVLALRCKHYEESVKNEK